MTNVERKDLFKRRHRERMVSHVADIIIAVFPDRDRSVVEKALSSLPEQEVADLYGNLLQHAFTDSLQFAAKTLASNGWFLDMDFPAKSGEAIAERFKDGNEEEAHQLMEILIDRRVEEIEQLATSHFPDRRNLISKGFRFHRAGDYEVSVPFLLIQADGICAEVFGREFFRIRNGEVLVRAAVEQKCPDWVAQALAQVFRSVPPIMAHAAPRSPLFNRHIILHGLSLDYGTRRNSLRSISLVAFLCGFKSYYEEKAAQPDAEPTRVNARHADEALGPRGSS